MGQTSSSDRPTRRGSFGGGPPRYLGGYFSASRFSTISGTMPATDVPKLATSLIRRDEMYVYFSCGIKNTVSTVLRSLRFISAIWNSYSKSDTARRPRTMQSACSRSTRSITSPSNDVMRRRVMPAVHSSISSSRSFTLNSGSFAGFAPTAMISSSKMRRLGSMGSRWPVGMGSNMPGYTAGLPTESPRWIDVGRLGNWASLRRGQKESQGRLAELSRLPEPQDTDG